MRGEECGETWIPANVPEIPPRARGRACKGLDNAADNGNTPACAGKSYLRVLVWCDVGKYPRVRGEESRSIVVVLICLEIPPRARGRVTDAGIAKAIGGNTPACAGKSL